MARQSSPQLEGAEVARVVRPALSKALDARLDDDPRRVEVGLPDAEADDVVHRRGDVEEPPDTGRRDDPDPLRQDALGQRRTGLRLGVGVGRHGTQAYGIVPGPARVPSGLQVDAARTSIGLAGSRAPSCARVLSGVAAARTATAGATAVNTARSRIPSICRRIMTNTPKPMTGPTTRNCAPASPNLTR